MLTVSGRGSGQVCVQVPPVPLQKIFDAPPDKLHRSSGDFSCLRSWFITCRSESSKVPQTPDVFKGSFVPQLQVRR